jgi:hypothetical protein
MLHQTTLVARAWRGPSQKLCSAAVAPIRATIGTLLTLAAPRLLFLSLNPHLERNVTFFASMQGLPVPDPLYFPAR